VIRLSLANRWVLLAARIVVAGIFLLAGLDKIVSVGAFADAVRSYHLLPASLVLPYAFAIPPLEILVGVYLLLGFQARLAALGSVLLLGMFMVALIRALILGDTNHACGCFGAGSTANPILAFLTGGTTITPWDVVRDLLLFALSGLIVLFGAGPIAAGKLFGSGRGRPDLEEARVRQSSQSKRSRDRGPRHSTDQST
jgi:uncharacterized membrane protein YphA (DoxX/SURF4 family)